MHGSHETQAFTLLSGSQEKEMKLFSLKTFLVQSDTNLKMQSEDETPRKLPEKVHIYYIYYMHIKKMHEKVPPEQSVCILRSSGS